MASSREELLEKDLKHLIHPLHNRELHLMMGPIIFVSGKGAIVKDTEGKEYLDGTAGLWNVAVGHGREELAQAAAEQMRKLAYYSAYTGFSNEPAIRLAAKLVEMSYPNMAAVFFASGGAEANESAFKMVRYYWKLAGYKDKVKIISRHMAYHGVTMAALHATGIPAYWGMFGPLPEGFLHIAAPYCYRCEFGKEYPGCGLACAEALAEAIEREGPETVAAFIAEPVQGAGGVMVPPPEYFPRVRQICDKYKVLLIADEVITGFGRTGKAFALHHWGVLPDLVTFAKAVTSGYIPLAGCIVSGEIFHALTSVSPGQRWMHSFTYSAHPTACAVALANLEIMEREGLVERARVMGPVFLSALGELKALPPVGDVRGIGLMAAVELVADRETKAKFPATENIGLRVCIAASDRGLLVRNMGDIIEMSPPLVASEGELRSIARILGEAIGAVLG